MAELPTMNVKIYAPFKTYFEGPANSLSAANKTGAFDVLPQHKNFMSLLALHDHRAHPPRPKLQPKRQPRRNARQIQPSNDLSRHLRVIG